MSVLFIISGPSGAGKTTLQASLEEQGILPVITNTTRDPRPGEVDGEHYNFIPKEDWDTLVPDLLESTIYNDNHYGITSTEVDLAMKRSPIAAASVVVDIVGIYNLRKTINGTSDKIDPVEVILSTKIQDLHHRLEERGTPERIASIDKEIKSFGSIEPIPGRTLYFSTTYTSLDCIVHNLHYLATVKPVLTAE